MTLLFFMEMIPQAKGAERTFTEYKVKALFLFNFAKYVDWPAEIFPATNSPIIIGIVGKDKFGDELEHAVEGKRVNGHGFTIKHLAANDDLHVCQILFIADSEASQMKNILNKLDALPVLTVGEDKAFEENGGIIDFILKENRVRLEINLAAMNRAKLRISSKLLAVADVVREKQN